MAFILVPLVLATIVLTTYSRTAGGVLGVDLWSIVMREEAQGFAAILFENVALWLALFGGAYLLLYAPGWLALPAAVRRYKLNPAAPKPALVRVEFLRSLRGLAIGSAMEAAWHAASAAGRLDGLRVALCPASLCGAPVAELGLGAFLGASLALYLGGDTHFYWSHRLLHTPLLYRAVHREHHESFNPDPFSGLSMHPVESVVYFSAAPLVVGWGPLWLTRLLFKALVVFPLEGHSGFGTWGVEASYNHYLHHTKFNWNYGSSPLWDHLMGTNYVDGSGRAAKEAALQAAVVGGAVGAGVREATGGVKPALVRKAAHKAA